MGFTKLNSNWLAARVGDVGLSGVDLTTTRPPDLSIQPWMEAVVPGTILGTLLENKLIPDPFFGLENMNIIDIADSGREYYTFWFFTKFNLRLVKHARAWLQFRGINYQGEVFLNGHQKLLSKGMFLRHILDVTDWINPAGPNYLAVLVHPPEHPGRIPPQGGQGGDHQIAKDVATQYVEGWDWMAPIRDRNTGIWDETSLLTTGPLKISDPHLVSSFFDNFKRVYIHVSTEIVNPTPASITCVIKLQVGIESKENVYTIEHSSNHELVIPGDKTALFTFPPVFLYKPELWWPKGMGKQALHKVDIILEVPAYGESDSWRHLFGLRKIESHIDPSTGGRLFEVNGEPLFVRGGNWIVSDGLLRLSEKRYKSDIDFHADMNFNMIRCWGGGIAERPEFYHHCDRRGLLVWQEFWITGDNNGRGADPPSDPNWPLDHQLFLACAKDTIKLLRNYASLALWVGGNEQHPAYDINDALRNYLELHPWFQIRELPTNSQYETSTDPSRYLDGTRLYIQGSLWDGFARGNGDFTDGPYTIQNPEDFFQDSFYRYGFNPEVGSVGMPVAATIKATMPQEAWQIPKFEKQKDGYVAEVPNPTWDYHKYIAYSNPGYVHDQIELYGEAKDLDDFCEKAQLVNYVQYRALMEGWTSRMWTKYTGVLIWKNQNPWTGLRGQFYDHLQDQTGGFFGVRCACEPIHVQLNLATHYIEVVNTTASSLASVSVQATVWCLDGSMPYHQVAQHVAIPSKQTTSIFEMKYLKSKNAQSVYFLLLKLDDTADGILLSRNFYWLYPPGGNYNALESFRSNKAPIRMEAKSQMIGRSCKLQVDVENLSGRVARMGQKGPKYDSTKATSSSCLISRLCPCWASGIPRLFPAEEPPPWQTTGAQPVVAFWLHLSVLDGGGKGGRILPVTYSQNYFSLTPGEKMSVEVSFEVPDGTAPNLVLSGWNIDEAVLPIHSLTATHE